MLCKDKSLSRCFLFTLCQFDWTVTTDLITSLPNASQLFPFKLLKEYSFSSSRNYPVKMVLRIWWLIYGGLKYIQTEDRWRRSVQKMSVTVKRRGYTSVSISPLTHDIAGLEKTGQVSRQRLAGRNAAQLSNRSALTLKWLRTRHNSKETIFSGHASTAMTEIS